MKNNASGYSEMRNSMKKTGIVAIAVALLLTGCAQPDAASFHDNNVKPQEEDITATPENPQDGDITPAPVDDSNELIELSYYGADEVLILDKDSGDYTSVKLEDLTGYPWGYESVLYFLDGDNLIASFYEQTDDGHPDGYGVAAINYKTREKSTIYHTDGYLVSVDYYNGAVYVVSGLHADGVTTYTETCLKKLSDMDYESSVTWEKTIASGYIKLNELMGNGYEHHTGCVTRSFDDLGFVMVQNDKELYAVGRDGNMSVLVSDIETGMVKGYSKDIVFLQKFGDSYELGIPYSLAIGNGEIVQAQVSGEDPESMFVQGDVMYFGVENPLNEDEKIVYSFDGKSGEVNEILTTRNGVGFKDVVLLSSVSECEGIYYYISVVDDSLCWCKSRGHGASDERVVSVIKDAPFREFGVVSSSRYVGRCPYCDNIIAKYYCETISLEMGCVGLPGVDIDVENKINDHIQKSYDEISQEFYDSCIAIDDSSCSYHDESVMNIQTEDWTLGSLDVIRGKYFQVIEDGYWYGGGAHGYPYMAIMIFDLATGEKISLKDLYHGSEEDFKTIVATATAEDMESGNYNPYFTETYDDTYAAAYEVVTLDTTHFTMDEDSLNIWYSPYEMGPYASGYITVEIPYEDLGISL